MSILESLLSKYEHLDAPSSSDGYTEKLEAALRQLVGAHEFNNYPPNGAYIQARELLKLPI